MVSPDYYIDFAKMIQVFVYDKNLIRPVKRGKQGERLVRPSDEKFMDNSNFMIGEFNPLCEALTKTLKGTYVGGGRWLGSEYFKSIGEKPYSV